MIDNDADFGPPGISVFDIYVRNGGDEGLEDPGLWVRKGKWRKTVARVVAVRNAGRGCDSPRSPPVVLVDYFDEVTGDLKTETHKLHMCCDRAGDYRRIDPPWWASAWLTAGQVTDLTEREPAGR